MLINKEKIQHINSIAHEGKIVVAATDSDGKIWYTVKQDGFEDSYLNQPPEQRTGWEAWEELKFPNEIDDESVLIKEKEELTAQQNNSIYFLRSRYSTYNQSAVAPVQLISGLGYIYVFRQSKSNTLLVDRFVLDGLTNKLVRKLEVRFKRSREKHTPNKNQKKGANGLVNIDSLDFRDIQGNYFYEPTTELSLINNLFEGWFSVVLLPTDEQDKYRWHIFAYNSRTEKVEITTLRASDEGLFDVKDYTVLAPEPRRVDGIIKRSLDLGNVTVAKGLAAVKYDMQRERQTDEGMNLLRESVHVMLTFGTGAGNVAAISFAVAADGTLSEITPQKSGNPENIRRSMTRQILLPPNTLDEIKAIAASASPPKGTIAGFARGENDEVILASNETTGIDAKKITQVKVSGNEAYNRLYSPVSKIDEHTFEITSKNANGGDWEIIPEEETGLIYNGIVTAYEITPDGKLKVTAFNHGLNSGDKVQVVDTKDYNGTYSVTKIDDKTFSLDGMRWQAGTAINLQAQKRRGIIFDGINDCVKIPNTISTVSGAFTVELWAKPNDETKPLGIVGSREPKDFGFDFKFQGGNQIHGNIGNGSEWLTTQADAQFVYKAGEWYHIAYVVTSNGYTIYVNGEEKSQGLYKLAGKPLLLDAEHIFHIGSAAGSERMNGSIADVRIWNNARSAEDIKNSMYLQLTGKEFGLAGYWRLDAIVGGKERKVVDFSTNGNDGIVEGGAYVSSVTLSRHLDRNKTVEAIKYENEELFAVSERATYSEEFEFKTDINFNVDNADGKIFAFVYKGKKNRSSQDWIDIETKPDSTEFTDLHNGWYKASASFIVPDGVSVMRSFGINDVRGNWTSLDIRKHQIQLVSDSITEAEYVDNVRDIQTLLGNQVDIQNDLQKLRILEPREAPLEKEKRDLEAQIALLNLPVNEAKTSKQAERDAQQRVLDDINANKNFWDSEYQAGLSSTVGSEAWNSRDLKSRPH